MHTDNRHTWDLDFPHKVSAPSTPENSIVSFT